MTTSPFTRFTDDDYYCRDCFHCGRANELSEDGEVIFCAACQSENLVSWLFRRDEIRREAERLMQEDLRWDRIWKIRAYSKWSLFEDRVLALGSPMQPECLSRRQAA